MHLHNISWLHAVFISPEKVAPTTVCQHKLFFQCLYLLHFVLHLPRPVVSVNFHINDIFDSRKITLISVKRKKWNSKCISIINKCKLCYNSLVKMSWRMKIHFELILFYFCVFLFSKYKDNEKRNIFSRVAPSRKDKKWLIDLQQWNFRYFCASNNFYWLLGLYSSFIQNLFLTTSKTSSS